MSARPLLVAGIVAAASVAALTADETKKLALTGTIRDVQGKPVGGATVTVAGAKPVVTGIDGTYRVDGVPSERALVVAEMKNRFRVKALLSAGRTGDAVWDATVGNPRTIKGRLIDEYGKGLANWWVAGASLQPWTRCGMCDLTDASGGFELSDEPRVLFRLYVAQHDHSECKRLHGDAQCHVAHIGVAPVAHVDALSPGVTDLVIRMPPERMPFAHVRCRVAKSD